MSNFTVKYRGSDGALKTEVISAGSRADALAQMKARGATPISVTEGGKIAAAVSSSTAKPAWLKGAIAGVVVVVAAVVAFICLMPSGKPADQKVEKPKKVKVETEKKAPAPQVQKPAHVEKAVEVKTSPIVSNDVPNVQEAPVGTYTNQNGKVLLRKPKRSAFNSATESYLAWMFTKELGDAPPPLLRFSKADKDRMWEILTSESPVNEGDSEKVAAAKSILVDAKRELKEYIKKGGTPEDFMEHYHNILVSAHNQWVECRKEAMRAIREDEPEVARAYIERINAQLDEKGFKHVVIPVKHLEKLGMPTEGQKESK